MGTLTLKDGKFWRDGVEVPPRIGDAEQIALLKHIEYAEREREECERGDGLPVSVYAELSMECICGQVLRSETCSDLDYGTDEITDWIERQDTYKVAFSCSCGRDYRINEHGYAKLVKPCPTPRCSPGSEGRINEYER
ncbi:hypothetical protein [uncultured Rikenella sp.]|uniref:hypothetical protein n=1 Tax=uncultured Rikenella sp. TaxID=368003 RepID=UPI00262C188A|nr:hypothetical protein [uncultured Rikenella sp.]